MGHSGLNEMAHVTMPLSVGLAFAAQDEMGEARAVMRTLKEERDEIRSHLDGMQVCTFFIFLICLRRVCSYLGFVATLALAVS